MPTTSPSNRRAKSPQPIDSSYAHLQPQAVDIEKIVLGALMIDSDAFALVSDTLRPETFYDPRHQHIYEAITALAAGERPIDIMTVTEELKRLGYLDSIGGEMYILELSSLVASSAHVEYHAVILKQKFLARQLISFASNIETKAFGEMTDVDDLMQEAESELFELSQKNMRQEYLPISTILNRAVDILQKAAQNTTGLTGVAAGFSAIDQITNGWQNSDLIIIAGRPAMGKTSFALTLAKYSAVDCQKPTAFFTLEMSDTQLANRLMSNVFEIEGRKMQSGQLDPDEWQRFDKNIERLRQAPLYIDETASLSVFELRTKARRLVRERGVEIIFIDYLQLMTASGMKFGNRQEEVSAISKSLKSLAKELNIPIIALSQLNRGLESREGNEGKRPQLSDLRESGAIEQDADLVLFVHRPEYYRIYDDGKGNDLRGKAEIIIAKHRKGATGLVTLRFRGEYTRFEEDSRDELPAGDGEIVGSRLNNLQAGPYAAPDYPDDPLGHASGDVPY
ncbi:MAG: replicative DNA helicase [Prevotella sp.]|nr:replicative DNA helicase [Prevotella sp.]MCD8305174.1 replicative DNA helicase [Prevotella sp.]